MSKDFDVPLGRIKQTEQQLHSGGLARTVGPQKSLKTFVRPRTETTVSPFDSDLVSAADMMHAVLIMPFSASTGPLLRGGIHFRRPVLLRRQDDNVQAPRLC